MLEYREVPDSNIVELVIDGAISAAEFDDMIKRLEGAIGRHGKIRVLEHVRSLGGIPPAKWWEDVKFGFRHMNDITRAAVVAEGKWLEIFANLVNPFLAAEISYFKPEEIERARAWLRQFPDHDLQADVPFMDAAVEEARAGLAEGGIPIGSVLVLDERIVGRGHNRRVQKGSAILHAEMDCLENAGRLPAADYRRATLFSTLSPCDMCSGAALLYGIRRIVIGENQTFRGPEDYVRSRGAELAIVNDPRCVELMREFIAAKPELWNEDIGV